MNKQILTGILGWYFDAFLIDCLIAPLQNRLGMNTDPISLLALLLLLGLFIASIWYHIKGKSRTSWISPGEYLIGTRHSDKGKTRVNPWPMSRLVLFLLVAFNLLHTNRTYDAGEIAFFGYDSLGMVILFSFIFNALLLIGSALLANARYAGLALVTLAFVYLAASHYVNYLDMDQPLHMELVKQALITSALNLIVGITYFILKVRHQRKPRLVAAD